MPDCGFIQKEARGSCYSFSINGSVPAIAVKIVVTIRDPEEIFSKQSCLSDLLAVYTLVMVGGSHVNLWIHTGIRDMASRNSTISGCVN